MFAIFIAGIGSNGRPARNKFGATVSAWPTRLVCRDPARGISRSEAAELWGRFDVYETSEDSLREWVGGSGTARTAVVLSTHSFV